MGGSAIENPTKIVYWLEVKRIEQVFINIKKFDKIFICSSLEGIYIKLKNVTNPDDIRFYWMPTHSIDFIEFFSEGVNLKMKRKTKRKAGVLGALENPNFKNKKKKYLKGKAK